VYAINVVVADVVMLSLATSGWTLRQRKIASGGAKFRVLAPLTLVFAVVAAALLVVRIVAG
jgi:hypothetical protein